MAEEKEITPEEFEELANKKQGYDTTELPKSDWVFILYDKISWAQSFQSHLAAKGFHAKVFVKGELLKPHDIVVETI